MGALTVAEILKLDIFKNVSISAGAAGLSRSVTGITTAEDPDLIHWLTAVSYTHLDVYKRQLLPVLRT